jgi:hypothetical protein
MKEVTMFNFESSYILKQKGCGYRFFELKERNGDTLTFRLRQKDNHKEVSGITFIPKDEDQEVFAFTWNGQRAFLTATDYIGKGYRIEKR